VKNMSPLSVVSFWKSVVSDLGNYLVTLDSLPEENTKKREELMSLICESLDKAGQLCMQTAVLHPTNMQHLIASTLDDGRCGVAADDKGLWKSVVASLQLNSEQENQIAALRDIFVGRMTRILENRQEILKSLRSVSVPDRLVALQSIISETLKVNESTTALKSNLQEEHLCGMEFIGTVFKTILSPLQKARTIVQSYPFYPDMYQIATVGAESVSKRVSVGAGQVETDAQKTKLLRSK